MANEVIKDSIGHNGWATRRLLAFVADQRLTVEQRAATGVGTFGTIDQTLDHIVRSDASYLARLLGRELPWPDQHSAAELTDLQRRAAESETLWWELLAEPFDSERLLVVDEGAHQVRAGILLAQAINHANHHREQVCAILTGLGLQPPDLQAWEYAWQTGRITRADIGRSTAE